MAANHKALIIGGPNVGKSHFVGQLTIRLGMNNVNHQFQLVTAPNDTSLVAEITDKLYSGLAGDHTSAGTNQELELSVTNNQRQQIELTVPDYGGEQVRQIVRTRELNQVWEEQIAASHSWLLFIRLDEIPDLEDIVTRGLPTAKALKTRNASAEIRDLPPQSFFIELLQILLYSKGVSTMQPVKDIPLTIVLSCWDTLENKAGTTPAAVLAKRLPFLNEFIRSTWQTEALSIIGLSSTGKTLNGETPDIEYVKKGPEHFGYIVLPDGSYDADLTWAIASAFGKR